MFNNLKQKIANAGKKKGLTWEKPEYPGNSSFLPPMLCTKTETYDNSFPDIVRIAESFAEVMPYAVDANGRRLVKQPQLMKALYAPNEEMSGTEFFETLITMLLVHPLVHILVWHYENGEPKPGGPITPKNVAGFTFLEKAAMSRVDGKVTFRQADRTWTRQDVITLSLNVNPYQLMRGYSPSQAIKKWATTDDYIAEYQAAQFSNGGVPAGIITVTAPTVEAYNEAVDHLIATHTGPQNANRIVYTHRPTSSIDGKPMAAGVEWTPFAQTNKEMALDSLFNQANKKIDMNFGVPEEIKGYLQNSNYASAEVADYVFSRRILYPKLVKVYSKFTHEMNRITGGLGFAISFDYELPVLTDTRKVQTEALVNLLNQGFSVDSSVKALGLPKSFLQLDKVTEAKDEVLQVEVTTSTKPSQEETSKIAHADYCEHCAHEAKSAENWEGVINPTLKWLIKTYLIFFLNLAEQSNDGDVVAALNKAKGQIETNETAQVIRTLTIGAIYYQLALNENESSKSFAGRLGLKDPIVTLSDTEITNFNMAVQSATSQVATLVESGESAGNVALTEVQDTISKITGALSAHGIHAALAEFAEGEDYERQLNWLLVKFMNDSINGWIERATETTEISVIRQIISDETYRVDRWALTEQHRGEELGKLLAAEETGEFAELEPYKIWRYREGACDHCVELGGETVRADLPFKNGNMVPADHPNCRCYYDVIFKPLAKSVKVLCPHCKRYMFESKGGEMKNVICANSKCKRHYDFKVQNGRIISKERSE